MLLWMCGCVHAVPPLTIEQAVTVALEKHIVPHATKIVSNQFRLDHLYFEEVRARRHVPSCAL